MLRGCDTRTRVLVVALRPRVPALPVRAHIGSAEESPLVIIMARAARHDDHKGMLPCFRRGRGSCFGSAVSSASISTGRVRRGSITSST